MARRFVAPAGYVQGPTVLDDLADHLGPVDATTACVLGGETALDRCGDAVVAGLECGGVSVERVVDGIDACTWPVVEEAARTVERHDAGAVVGVGGGVALDVATAAAVEAGAELVAVPTVASTDAPCSRVAIVYDEDGGFEEVVFRDRNPELVAVDTATVARAPARYLRYGMGDAIATAFEAQTVAEANGTTDAGADPSGAALALARAAYERVVADGPDALAAIERDRVTPAVERAVEATVLCSGLGFESGGVAAAHAVHNGFRDAGVHEPHGLLVAFGTLAHLALVDREDDLRTVGETYADLGLAADLADLDAGDEFDAVARNACEQPLMDNLPFEVTPADVLDALRTAERTVAQSARS